MCWSSDEKSGDWSDVENHVGHGEGANVTHMLLSQFPGRKFDMGHKDWRITQNLQDKLDSVSGTKTSCLVKGKRSRLRQRPNGGRRSQRHVSIPETPDRDLIHEPSPELDRSVGPFVAFDTASESEDNAALAVAFDADAELSYPESPEVNTTNGSNGSIDGAGLRVAADSGSEDEEDEESGAEQDGAGARGSDEDADADSEDSLNMDEATVNMFLNSGIGLEELFVAGESSDSSSPMSSPEKPAQEVEA
eukprot:CAMPEP_0118874214 /NCGR_PEP_ID=MMETSP1163-20130328/15739_1 /TAXON_ID=124430 /ORGANISM="Phaeomonas parva, Strain CCMP2877" /LENGTH=248 /DNA_ID=CAMNT_0006809585 /DNA_START=20 /DNA_END=766 /DNA_ORIENTATION=-